jgi:hypothetical protein
LPRLALGATALRAGEVNFANLVPREQVKRLSRDPQIAVIRGKDTQRIVTQFNLRKPIFLRRVTRDRDWEQMLVNVAAAIDPHTISHGIDTRAGNNAINHADQHVDALIDRMWEAARLLRSCAWLARTLFEHPLRSTFALFHGEEWF